MARSGEVRKLTRLGSHSYYVVLPPWMVRELGWRGRQKVVVELRGTTVQIKDWQADKT